MATVREQLRGFLVEALRRLAPLIAMLSRLTCRRRAGCLMLPPEDGGSLGDDAMVESVLSAWPGIEVRILAYGSSGYAERTGRRSGGSLNSWWFPAAFAWQAGRVSNFVVLGADVLDGRYSRENSARRLALADLASDFGARVSIIGFSMSDDESSIPADAWRSLDRRVDLVCRDAISQARVERLTGRHLGEGADLAFLLEPRPIEGWIRPDSDCLIGFVPNYLFGQEFGGAGPYVTAVSDCLARVLATLPGTHIVLYGHDRRGQPSDFDLALLIAEKIDSDRVHAVTRIDSVHEAKWLAGKMDVLISCRLHAAIGALGGGVPAAVLAYQGKVEGVLGMLGLADTAWDRMDYLSDPYRFARSVCSLVERRKQLARLLDEHTPHVKELAYRTAMAPFSPVPSGHDR